MAFPVFPFLKKILTALCPFVTYEKKSVIFLKQILKSVMDTFCIHIVFCYSVIHTVPASQKLYEII